ncbi:MAG TPA: hypothetical protein LFW13_01275 [Rickettsia endosymbiont of Sericostoma sp.]|nr:hypothetical protein [Rickettsia endosymbiont of Sericostoma sp.]
MFADKNESRLEFLSVHYLCTLLRIVLTIFKRVGEIMQQEQFVYSQKNNFSGGELTPTIEGRTELALYQNGVKKLINFMLLPSGGIMRRHGTQFVHLFDNNGFCRIYN